MRPFHREPIEPGPHQPVDGRERGKPPVGGGAELGEDMARPVTLCRAVAVDERLGAALQRLRLQPPRIEQIRQGPAAQAAKTCLEERVGDDRNCGNRGLNVPTRLRGREIQRVGLDPGLSPSAPGPLAPLVPAPVERQQRADIGRRVWLAHRDAEGIVRRQRQDLADRAALRRPAAQEAPEVGSDLARPPAVEVHDVSVRILRGQGLGECVGKSGGKPAGLAPPITLKTWKVAQQPRFSTANLINFPLVRQVESVAPKHPSGRIIPTKSTHVNLLDLLYVFKDAGGKGEVVDKLGRLAAVTHVEIQDDWMLIARDGKELGYVHKSYEADDKLARLQ